MSRAIPDTTAGGYRCDSVGCDAVATSAPCIMTPYEGFPIEVKRPIMSQVDVHVCPRHRKDVTLDGLWSKPLRESIEECAIANNGRPAFARAYIEFVRCHSPEFLEFQQVSGLVPPDDGLVKGPGIILPDMAH